MVLFIREARETRPVFTAFDSDTQSCLCCCIPRPTDSLYNAMFLNFFASCCGLRQHCAPGPSTAQTVWRAYGPVPVPARTGRGPVMPPQCHDRVHVPAVSGEACLVHLGERHGSAHVPPTLPLTSRRIGGLSFLRGRGILSIHRRVDHHIDHRVDHRVDRPFDHRTAVDVSVPVPPPSPVHGHAPLFLRLLLASPFLLN